MSTFDEAVNNAWWNAASVALGAYEAMSAPHVLMKPAVFPDGDAWCALLGDNLQEGVAGFGDTPAKACAAFDAAWRNSLTPQAERKRRINT